MKPISQLTLASDEHALLERTEYSFFLSSRRKRGKPPRSTNLHRVHEPPVLQKVAKWSPSPPREERAGPLGSSSSRAFTLIELLVVICVLALLVATLAPALAGSRVGSQTLRCMNNARQLTTAWRHYADDSSDRLVYASGLESTMSNTNSFFAWTTTPMDSSAGNTANWDINVDIVKRPFWSYTSKDASIYRCPSDHSYIVTPSFVRPRVRSYAMNLYTGGFAPPNGSGPAGTDGGLSFAAPFRIFSKSTDIVAPGPARTFVFIDARPETTIFPEFITDMTGYPTTPSQYRFVDFPGISHNLGAGVSFADGRVEMRRWLDPRTAPPMNGVVIGPIFSPNNVDIAWLQARATSPK